VDTIRPTQRQVKARNAVRFRERYMDRFEIAYRSGDADGVALNLRKAQYWQARWMRLTSFERSRGLAVSS
jgi:hypothetical protein